ncbi:MAG: hypothetical protein ACFCUJ_14255 [Thiotrichales bacterium]
MTLPAIVLVLSAALPWTLASAQTYRYTGNMPMAKAMLDMMVVLGYVQRVPDHYPGSYGYSPGIGAIPGLGALSSMGGLPGMGGWPGMPGMSGMPGMPGLGGWPGMGSLPGMGNLGGMSGLPMAMWGLPAMGSPMSAQGMNPGNWLNSAGNPLSAWGAQQGAPSPGWFGATPSQSPSSASPWNWGAQSPAGRGDGERIQMSVQDLQSLLDTVRKSEEGMRSPSFPASDPVRESLAAPALSQPATTGGQTPIGSLDGLWRGTNDDLLQIEGNQFTWTDKAGQATHGVYMLQGEMLYAKTAYSEQPVIYRVSMAPDGFVAIMQPGDFRYEFKRAR